MKQSRRRIAVGGAAGVAGLLALWLWLGRARPVPAPTEVQVATPAPAETTTETAEAASGRPARIEPSSTGLAPHVASAEIRAVVDAHRGPGRMVFLDLELSAAGLRLIGATGAIGRAKPAVERTGFGFIRYEAFDASGRITARGSVEDPTRRRREFPDATGTRIERTFEFSEAGTLFVRLPGEAEPVRLVFFRDFPPLRPAAGGREILGEFILRS